MRPEVVNICEQVALAPPIAALLASAVAGSAADGLVTAGWPVARVRKLAQCIAFLGPAACLVAAALLEDEWAAVGEKLTLLTIHISLVANITTPTLSSKRIA